MIYMISIFIKIVNIYYIIFKKFETINKQIKKPYIIYGVYICICLNCINI